MRTILVAALALLAVPAQAQVTLKQLLDSADQQNIDRRVAQENLNRAEAEYRQQWTGLLPSVSAQAAWTHNQYEAVISVPMGTTVTKLTIQPFDQFDGSLRFDLPLIDTGRWFRTMSAGLSQEAAVERQASVKDQIRRQVVVSWYSYAAALALRESAKRTLTVAESQLKLQEIRAGAGAATELELLRARAEVQRNKQTISDLDAQVAIVKRQLRTLSGLEPGDVATLPADDLKPESGFEALEGNINALPQVKAADKDVEVAGKQATASRLVLIPTVGAQFTERVTNATGFAGQASTFNLGVALTWRLDVPTFQAMQVTSAVEATQRLNAERARLLAKDQIYSDWQRLNASLSKLVSAQAQVESAQRAAQVSRDRYAVGASTQVDVIQAERDLFLAEVSQIQARTEAASARASLRISAGVPLGVD